MRDCRGDLAHVTSSYVAVSRAEVARVTPNFNFIYSSASRLLLSNFNLRDMSFSDTGGLMTIIDNSEVRVLGASFSDIASSEHGFLRIHNSTFESDSLKVVNYNATFIDSTLGHLTFSRLTVRQGLMAQSGARLALIPSGGFVICEDCPSVTITDASVAEVSAKAGGVLYLYGLRGGNLDIERSTFANCSAVATGGIVETTEYSIRISESKFINNSATSGGVISTSAKGTVPVFSQSLFQYNSALTDGSCIQWTGAQPQVIDSVFEDNTALYGDPMASTPRYWHLVDPDSRLPINQSLVGVAGQEMQDVFNFGVFDAMGQLISTDNSSFVYLKTESYLNVSGNVELIASEGLANFFLMFTPYFVGVVNITVTGGSLDVVPYTFQLTLRDCEPGEIRTPNGCFPCPKNSYSLSPDDSTCSLCIEHAECWGQTDMRLFPDYWRSSILTDDIYECLNRDACLGGLNSDCAKGYQGTLCGVCEQGYYRWVNWDCRSCKEGVPAPARALLITLVVLLPVTLLPILATRSEGILCSIAWSFRRLLVYSQSMTFISLMNAKWSFDNLVYFEVLQTVGSFGSNLLHWDCEFKDSSALKVHLIGTALFPLLLLSVSAIVWLVSRVFKRVSTKTILVSFGISLYHFTPMLLLVCAESLQCIEVAGRHYVVRDLREECYTGEHLRFALSASVPLALVSLFVFGLGMKLMQSQSPKHLELSQYLRAGYKSSGRRWEWVEVSRWYGVALFCVFFPQTEVKSQTVLLAALFVLSVLHYGQQMPCQQLWMNAAGLASHGFTVSFLLVRLCTNGDLVPAAGLLFLCCLLALLCVGCAKYRWRLSATYPVAADNSFASEVHLAPYPSVINSMLNVSSEAILPSKPNIT